MMALFAYAVALVCLAAGYVLQDGSIAVSAQVWAAAGFVITAIRRG